MTPRAYCFMKPAIIILVLCILAAGCTSAPVAKPVPTSQPTPYMTKAVTPVPVPQVTVSDDGSKTCTELKGTPVVPGQVCPGSWLNASDSFSCCSKTPVAGKSTKTPIVVAPLDLRLSHNDTFVSIGTG